MKFSRHLTAIVLVLLAIGCVSGDQKRGTRHYNIIAVEDEWQLGAQLSADIARRVQLNSDPQALTYIRSLGERLARQTTMSNLPWEFHIINSPEFDAFAIPGGHIYVTSGAIKTVRSASELAALLAHELGHAVDRQTIAALSTQYGVRELAHAANGSNQALYDQVLNQLLPAAPRMRFSFEDETVADDSAVKWMQPAGEDPNGLVTLIQLLQGLQTSNASVAQRFLSAHPLAGVNIAGIQGQISKLPKKTGLITDEPEFHAVQGRM